MVPPDTQYSACPEAAASNEPAQVTVRSHGEIMFDERKRQNKNVFESFEKAMLFRDALVADLSYNPRLGFDAKDAAEARKSLVSRGVIDRDGAVKRAYATFPQAAGGALTSPAFLPDLLKNVNKWGIGRQLAKVVPMQNDVVNRPKHSGTDPTVTYQNDNTATTAITSTPYSTLSLQAKTGIILNQVSKNLMNDAGIDVAQDFAEDITRSFAKAEDKALFVGDGTATYAGMKGFTQRFADLGLSANGGGLLYQAAANMSSYTDANLSSLIALLPDYAWDNACFVCSPAALALIFNRLSATAPTGTSLADFSSLNFKTRSQYRGLPIMVTNAMNSTDAAAANTIDVLFGDFSRAAMIGDRLSLDIALDESYGFNAYSVYIRGVFRHDVNVHDFGTTTVAGPVVAMSQS
jgi:HK97 family phage major capsid protein